MFKDNWKSKKRTLTQAYKDRWKNKLNVVCTYNRIVFVLKKEGNAGTCYHMDEPWGQLC